MVATALDAQNVREGHKHTVRISFMGKEAYVDTPLMIHEMLIATYNCITAVGLIHHKLEDSSTLASLEVTGMGKSGVAR